MWKWYEVMLVNALSESVTVLADAKIVLAANANHAILTSAIDRLSATAVV